MADIKTFITDARAKGLSDEHIRQALKTQGWDDSAIEVGLSGLDVPTAEKTTLPPASTSANRTEQRASLSPLMAALHHVLLWFFTASSTVTIAGVVASLSGFNVSTNALASMIAVTAITFTPYAGLFIVYLVKLRKQPELVPGKVWPIITICLHSIGAMIAAITIVISLINSGEWSVILSAILVLTLDLLVVLAYCFAAFVGVSRIRKVVTLAYLPFLLILFGILFVMSLLQLAPARHDEQLRKDLTTTVQKVSAYTKEHSALPSDSTPITVGDTQYKLKDDRTYDVCGTFQTSGQKSTYSGGTLGYQDDYVSDSQFMNSKSGTVCFSFTSTSLGGSQGASLIY